MRMAHSDDIDRRDADAHRPGNVKDAKSASEGNEGKAEGEKVRALHDFARRMDKLLLRWAQAKGRPEGGLNNDR